MKKWIYIAWSLALIGMVSCESLEETYDEYAGDGMIRYVGKCPPPEISRGWYRLKVKWRGNIDAAIHKVKLSYQGENETEPTVLWIEPQDILDNESLMDSIYLENLENSVYTITLSNVTADSMESIAETAYERPYTLEHEDLRSFTRGIVNFYVLGDRLALFLDEANENIIKMDLSYWDKSGTHHLWDMKEVMETSYIYPFLMEKIYDYVILLEEEIDFTQPITVLRKGLLEGCIDTVSFNPDTLSLDEEVWSSGFSRYLTRRFGKNYTRADIESVEEIELDYNITTFRDLLYFPNLKKVVLGKNRYIAAEYATVNMSTTDEYSGLTTLQLLKDTRGVTVERYNKQYFGDMYTTLKDYRRIDNDLIVEMGNANMNKMPVIQPLDTTGWKVTCSDTLHNGYKRNGAAFLLDGDQDTYLQPEYTFSASVVEVEYDMQKLQLVKGFKVMQPNAPANSGEMDEYLKHLVSAVKVEVSIDGISWQSATHEDGGITIGNAPGEVTFIEIPESLQKEVRFIRFSMTNQQVSVAEGSPLFTLRLADIIPY